MKPKVSIITPCYNGEKFIKYYFDGIISQDYDNIELIIVNDGSTDKSEELILEQSKRLDPAKVTFCYIKKSNGGQPSAINEGLKRFTGAYLTWPDIDDRMHPDYLSKKVAYLEEHRDVDLLVTQCAVISTNEPDKIICKTWETWKGKEEALQCMLDDVGFYYEPGNYMVRTESFLHHFPQRTIYDACGKWCGPQIQMLFPFFRFNKVGYLKECLYDYYLHGNNDHMRYSSVEGRKTKFRELEKLYDAVIEKSSVDEKEKKQLLHCIRIQLAWKYYRVAFSQWAPSMARYGAELLQKEGMYSLKKRIHTWILCQPVTWKIYVILKNGSVLR